MDNAPIVQVMTKPLTSTSVAYPLPNINYTHYTLTATTGCWIKGGGPAVVAVIGGADSFYIPPNTPITFPTARFVVEGITHFAIIRHSGEGFLSIGFRNAIYTATDCLIAIYDMIRQELIRYYGKPGYTPGIGPYKAHTDY